METTTPSGGFRSVDLDNVRVNLSLLNLTPKSSGEKNPKPRKLFAPIATAPGVEYLPTYRHQPPPWNIYEHKALVAFILLYSEGSSWPSRAGKTNSFWEKAGHFVQKQVKSEYCRTGLLYASYKCMSV